MKKSGLTLTEVMLAVSILAITIAPVMHFFSNSARQLERTSNVTFATGIARNISQKLQVLPYDVIADIDPPGIEIADGPDDFFFNPLVNPGISSDTALRIDQDSFPELYVYLKRFQFRYALSVVEVNFEDDDYVKSVDIQITWRERNRDMLYRMHTYVVDN